ncbi:MAG: hypothetical protein E6P95_00750 [Candidatus Moraniibacteriota bacterium]|nr:MAG: hypothetical protein E6P95_00750 [Candidatus Moranbacteria bacterium]
MLAYSNVSIFAAENTIQTLNNTVNITAKDSYSISEDAELLVGSKSNFLQKFIDFIGGESNDTKLKVFNPIN